MPDIVPVSTVGTSFLKTSVCTFMRSVYLQSLIVAIRVTAIPVAFALDRFIVFAILA